MNNSICLMREVFRALSEFENELIRVHDVTLNEAMLLCCLDQEDRKVPFSASDISEKTGLTASHTSKVLRSAEAKELIERSLGSNDHRKMFFELSQKGKERLVEIKRNKVEIPSLLKKLL